VNDEADDSPPPAQKARTDPFADMRYWYTATQRMSRSQQITVEHQVARN